MFTDVAVSMLLLYSKQLPIYEIFNLILAKKKKKSVHWIIPWMSEFQLVISHRNQDPKISKPILLRRDDMPGCRQKQQ